MRNPNGYGSVFKLSGKRRRPFVAKKTIGFDDRGYPIYQVIGYYEKREQAMLALAEFNKNPFVIGTDKITFEEVFALWKTQKYEGASQSTKNGYNAAFKNSQMLHAMKFNDIKTAHLSAAILKCTKGHGSLRKMKILYNQLFEYAMTNDIVTKDYSQYVELGKNKEKAVRIPFSKNEIDALFMAAPDIPYVDTVLIMIFSGVRPGELLNIKKKDIMINEGFFIVTDSKTEAGENRPLPINHKIKPFIESRLTSDGEFLITYKNKQVGYDYYYRSIFAPIMEQLGMQHRPHDCRHTFATLLNNADANATSIKNMIGHSSFALTEKTYTHKDIVELKKAIDLI